MIVLWSVMPLWILLHYILLLIYMDHLSRMSFTSLVPHFFKTLGKSSFPSLLLWGCPSGSNIYWSFLMDASGCPSIVLPTGKKYFCPSGAHIKILPLRNFYEDRTWAWVSSLSGVKIFFMYWNVMKNVWFL
jgi:hypothetical protein